MTLSKGNISFAKIAPERMLGGKGSKSVGPGCPAGGPEPASDVGVKWLNQPVPGHLQPAAQIIPHRYAELVASLGEAQKRIAAIAADIAAGSGADLPPGDVTTDVIFGTVGVQRCFRPIQHHQQLGFVGMQPLQQAVQRDEAGAAQEDAIKLFAQRDSPARAWLKPVSLEISVEVPDQTANPRLRGLMAVGEGV